MSPPKNPNRKRSPKKSNQTQPAEKSLFRPIPEPPPAGWSIFRRRFTRGLAVILPTLLTIAILLWAYDLMYRTVGQPINRGFVTLLSALGTPGEGGALFRLLKVDEVEDAIRYGQKIDQVDRLGRQQTVEALVLATKEPEAGQYGSEEAYQNASKAYWRERYRILWRIAFSKYWLHLVGFGIALVLCYFVGLFLASFIGHSAWKTVESFFRRLPIVKAIYPNVKQVTDFLFTESNVTFGGVVAVRYPRKGTWSVGLKTGGPMKSIVERTGEDLVTIFIPSSPTPFTGYVIQVPSEDVIDLPMSIDQALRFAISGGVIKPDTEILPGSEDFQPAADSERALAGKRAAPAASSQAP